MLTLKPGRGLSSQLDHKWALLGSKQTAARAPLGQIAGTSATILINIGTFATILINIGTFALTFINTGILYAWPSMLVFLEPSVSMLVLLQWWSTTSGSIINDAPWAICSFLWHICPQSCAHPTQVCQLGSISSSFFETSWRQKVNDKRINLHVRRIKPLIVFVGDLRAREGSKNLLHHSEVLPEMRNSHSCNVAISLRSHSYSCNLISKSYRLSWVWKRVKPR